MLDQKNIRIESPHYEVPENITMEERLKIMNRAKQDVSIMLIPKRIYGTKEIEVCDKKSKDGKRIIYAFFQA